MELGWFDHLLFFVVGIVLPLITYMTERPQAVELEDEEFSLPPKKHIYYTNGLVLIIGALIVLTLWNVTFRSFDVLGINYPIIDKIVYLLCGITIVIYSVDTFYNYINSKKVKEDTKALSLIMPTSWQDYQHFIFLAIAAGVCEEIVFRGFLVNYIIEAFETKSYNYYLALLIPALIFSVSHIYQGVFAVIKIFSLSLLFGAIFLFSKSLLLVIIIHVLVDLISGAVMVKVYSKDKD
jgi:uncharacterized protein